jgi:hypothetical protein
MLWPTTLFDLKAELAKYAEKIKHFLVIKNKIDLIRDSTTVQVKLDNFLIKKD